MQMDIYSGFSHHLARQLVAAAEKRKPRGAEVAEAVQLLRDWDGRMDRDQAAPLIAVLAYEYMRKAVAESAAPGAGASMLSDRARGHRDASPPTARGLVRGLGRGAGPEPHRRGR